MCEFGLGYIFTYQDGTARIEIQDPSNIYNRSAMFYDRNGNMEVDEDDVVVGYYSGNWTGFRSMIEADDPAAESCFELLLEDRTLCFLNSEFKRGLKERCGEKLGTMLKKLREDRKQALWLARDAVKEDEITREKMQKLELDMLDRGKKEDGRYGLRRELGDGFIHYMSASYNPKLRQSSHVQWSKSITTGFYGTPLPSIEVFAENYPGREDQLHDIMMNALERVLGAPSAGAFMVHAFDSQSNLDLESSRMNYMPRFVEDASFIFHENLFPVPREGNK